MGRVPGEPSDVGGVMGTTMGQGNLAPAQGVQAIAAPSPHRASCFHHNLLLLICPLQLFSHSSAGVRSKEDDQQQVNLSDEAFRALAFWTCDTAGSPEPCSAG